MGEVIQFRRPAPTAAPFDEIEPTQEEVVAALVAILVASLPDNTRRTFRRKFQAAYDNAPSPEHAAAVKRAAQAVWAPLMAKS